METRERKQGLGRDKEEIRKRTRKRKQGRGGNKDEGSAFSSFPPSLLHRSAINSAINSANQFSNQYNNQTAINTEKLVSMFSFQSQPLSLSLSSYLFQLPRRRHFPECFPPQRTLGNLRSKTEQDGRRRMGGENNSGEEEEWGGE